MFVARQIPTECRRFFGSVAIVSPRTQRPRGQKVREGGIVCESVNVDTFYARARRQSEGYFEGGEGKSIEN